MRRICFSAHVKKGISTDFFVAFTFFPGGTTVPKKTRINVPVPPFLKGGMISICLAMLEVMFANIGLLSEKKELV